MDKRKAIVDILSDLGENLHVFCDELVQRKEEPRVTLNKVEKKPVREIAKVLISTYGGETGAVKVAAEVLSRMDCKNEAKQLLALIEPGSRNRPTDPSPGSAGLSPQKDEPHPAVLPTEGVPGQTDPSPGSAGLSPEKDGMFSKKKEKTFPSVNEVLGTYPMTAAKRGICLIVNNKTFKVLKPRHGTDNDAECLSKVFGWLGFETVLREDLTGEEILSEMQHLGRRDHRQRDCLVCCILSHGGEGSVYGVDDQPAEIKKLMESVNGSHCPSLAGKPKLFFIQACQGNRGQEAVYAADGHAESSISSDKASGTIPADADFLLGISSIPSFVSWRHPKEGSWYIQSLCRNLVHLVPICDLVSIMTKVNADVSEKDCEMEVQEQKQKLKQMPQIFSMLRKNIVFPTPKAPAPVLPA